MTRVAWIECGMGAAGDMLLGALAELGAVNPPAVAAALGIDAGVTVTNDTRGGLAGMRVAVTAGERQPRRTWPDIRVLLTAADLPAPVRERALAVFERLAAVEGTVHGVEPEEVHFHEVGALDALVDIVGVCWGFHALGVGAITASPVALGGGSARTEHGVLPVPVPAVLRLLADVAAPSYGGPVDLELCTPTGAALLAEFVTAWGPLPAMVVEGTGTGLGSRDVPGRPNVLRVVVGSAITPDPAAAPGGALLLETNVDDMEGRLWPGVLDALIAAGASDAWLTPILMKKGRPAHTLSVLVPAGRLAEVRRVVFTHTTTLGLRERAVGKVELERRWDVVEVDGHPIAVKIGLLEGEVVTVQPEWEDVRAAAAALGRPPKAIVAAALALHATHDAP